MRNGSASQHQQGTPDIERQHRHRYPSSYPAPVPADKLSSELEVLRPTRRWSRGEKRRGAIWAQQKLRCSHRVVLNLRISHPPARAGCRAIKRAGGVEALSEVVARGKRKEVSLRTAAVAQAAYLKCLGR